MKLRKIIWQDIRRGENIDLYITAIVSIALAFLNVTGVVQTASVAPLVLAVLALISITILGNRHRLEQLLERTSISSQKELYEDFPSEFNADLEKAREVWLVGIHQNDFMVRFYSLFKEKLKRGDRLKVLLVEPNGAASKMTAMRFPGKVAENQEQLRIQSSLSSLCDLKNVAPDRLEIRVIDFLFAYGGFILDPDHSGGIAYIQRYTFRTQGGARKPKFVYRRDDRRWYDLICCEVRELWECAKPWDCQVGGNQP